MPFIVILKSQGVTPRPSGTPRQEADVHGDEQQGEQAKKQIEQADALCVVVQTYLFGAAL